MKKQETNKVTGEGIATYFLLNLLIKNKKIFIESRKFLKDREIWDLLIQRKYISTRICPNYYCSVEITKENMEKIETTLDVDQFKLDFYESIMERSSNFQDYPELLFWQFLR